MLPGVDAVLARKRRLSWLLPVAAAVALHAGTLRCGLVLDDTLLEKRRVEISALDPPRALLENYLVPGRADAGYRPLTFLTFALELRAGGAPWHFHLVNVLLHAAAALLAYLVLREILPDDLTASLGAALFAALPTQTDAVARILGRAEILSGIAILGAWLLALRNSAAGAPQLRAPAGGGAPGAGRRERAALVIAAGAITFLGLFAKEDAAAVVPLLILAGSWLTRRPVPWLTVAATLCAILGHLAIRGVILEGRPCLVTHTGNPLVAADSLALALNGPGIIGLYAWQILFPLRLSAEYTSFEVATRSPHEPTAWLLAGAIIAAVVLGVWFFRRRAPAASLGLLVFTIGLAPFSSALFPAGRIFAEREAYTASLGWPLVLGASLGAAPLARRRSLAVASAILLFALYGARTLARNEDWARGDPVRLTLGADSPERTRDLFRAYGDLLEKARSAQEKTDLRERSAAEADGKLRRNPSDGWAEALEGHILHSQGKYADAVERLTRAEGLLAAMSPPVSEPLLHELRGSALLVLGKAPQAFQDLDRSIRMLESAGKRPDGALYSRRGLSRAQVGRLPEALQDFNAAIALRQDVAEIWNNRGFCRFQLEDFEGALEDYKRGLSICQQEGVLYAQGTDSVHAFLLRIADVELARAKKLFEAKDEEGARAAAAEAAKRKAEAERLVPSRPPP